MRCVLFMLRLTCATPQQARKRIEHPPSSSRVSVCVCDLRFYVCFHLPVSTLFVSDLFVERIMASLRIVRRFVASSSSGSSSAADSYFGPGGLSARQIFEKVRESRHKEAAYARQQQHQQQSTKRPSSREQEQEQQEQQEQSVPSSMTQEELSAATSKQLRAALIARDVDVTDCFERSDLVARARLHLL